MKITDEQYMSTRSAMNFHLLSKSIGYLLFLATALLAAPAAGADGLKIELNKLEEADDACRAYLLFENRTDSEFRSLKLDLVMFGLDEGITKRLAIEGGPLPKDKTSVKLFEISGLKCETIGRILLNDVINCQDSAGEKMDGCIEMVTTSSKNKVALFK
jgi:hypothetical protein